jgi:hypothetical protein
MLPIAVAIAMLGVIGAFGASTKGAEAIQGDICAAYVGDADGEVLATEDFDGQGNDVYVVAPDTTYGLVFRVQDIMAGWLFAAAFEDELDDPDADEVDDSFDIALAGVLPGPNVHAEVDSETGSARITSQAQAYSFDDRDDVTIGAGTVDDLWLVPNVTHVLINPGVISQLTQTYSPRYFNNSSGFPVDGINGWLADHAGMSAFASNDTSVCGAGSCAAFDAIFEDELDGVDPDDATESGEVAAGTIYPCDDAWGYIDFQCTEAGYFNIDLRTDDIQWGAINDALLPLIEEALDAIDGPLPPFITPQEILEQILYWNLDPARTGMSLKFFCGGQADAAEIMANPETVETNPVGSSKSSSIITVTVEDQSGARIDGVTVHFTTDNCKFSNPESANADDTGISPAGGGTSVHTTSDSDSTADDNFLSDNPLEAYAGTAEVSLDCATGTPGTATVTAIVERPGSDITLTQDVTVVGPTGATGLTLTLTPDELECGETLLASVTAVDANGAPVSDGSKIYFTTDTTSGVVGGVEGAQGGISTVDGEASVLIATDPSNPGTHTVIAYALKGAVGSDIVAQTSATYTCEGAVAPVVPTVPVNPPGTGTGTISPPNTGDAGLASGNGSNLFAIVGAVAFALVGLASVRFARN